MDQETGTNSNLGEIGVISLALFAGFPLPLLPLHILWINLIGDGLPALALGLDPSEKKIMHAPPRKKTEGILHNSLGFLISAGIVGTTITLIMFLFGYNSLGLDAGRTFALMTLVMFELFLVFSSRSLRKTNFGTEFFNNRYLIYAVLFSIMLQFLLIYVFNDFFGLIQLKLINWLQIFFISFLGVSLIEFSKRFY